jgi:hypothetical protein
MIGPTYRLLYILERHQEQGLLSNLLFSKESSVNVLDIYCYLAFAALVLCLMTQGSQSQEAAKESGRKKVD